MGTRECGRVHAHTVHVALLNQHIMHMRHNVTSFFVVKGDCGGGGGGGASFSSLSLSCCHRPIVTGMHQLILIKISDIKFFEIYYGGPLWRRDRTVLVGV